MHAFDSSTPVTRHGRVGELFAAAFLVAGRTAPGHSAARWPAGDVFTHEREPLGAPARLALLLLFLCV